MTGSKETVPGSVEEVLTNERFRVRLEDGRSVIAYIAGKGRIDIVRLIPGDGVTVEVSSFDRGKARVVARRG